MCTLVLYAGERGFRLTFPRQIELRPVCPLACSPACVLPPGPGLKFSCQGPVGRPAALPPREQRVAQRKNRPPQRVVGRGPVAEVDGSRLTRGFISVLVPLPQHLPEDVADRSMLPDMIWLNVGKMRRDGHFGTWFKIARTP